MARTAFPLGGVTPLLERDDLPLPTGVLSPGTAPVVAVATALRHPSDAVLVQTRRDGGPATFLQAVPEGTLGREGQQWYQVALPAVAEGQRVDYRIELIRAGQQLATLPSDGSWLTMTGRPEPVAAPARQVGANSARSPSSAAGPLWAFDVTFFATLTAQLRPVVIGATPEGYRINFMIESGHVVGPRIDAVLRPEGGDWICIRPDGIGMVDLRCTYQTADGALIYDRAGGVFDLGADGYVKVTAGQFSGTHPYYPALTYTTAHPDWTWLNRCQAFGIGRVAVADLRVECDIYIPQVLERRSDG